MPPIINILGDKIFGSQAQSKTPLLNTDNLRSHLLRGAAGSFVVQIGFAGLSFINALVFARMLGPEGYGAYANAIAWVTMIVIPASFGLGTSLIREVAIYYSQKEWASLKGILRFANSFVIALSVLFAIIYIIVTGMIFSKADQMILRSCLWIAAPLIPLFALIGLNEASLRGLEYVVRARIPNMIIRPGFLLAGVIIVYVLWPDRLDPQLAMVVNVGTSILAFTIGLIWLRNRLPANLKFVLPQYEVKSWLVLAFPMLIYGGMQVALGQAGTIVLGALSGAKDVGLFAASSRLAYFLTFVTISFETILAPIMARLYKNGEIKRLQNILTRAVRISFLAVLPLGLIMIIANKTLLSIFGSEFNDADIALNILVIGRLIDIALGSGALALAMVGYERTVAKTFAGMFVINVFLNIALIPQFGLNGAAFASIVCVIITDFLLSIFAMKKAGLKVTIFAPKIKMDTNPFE